MTWHPILDNQKKYLSQIHEIADELQALEFKDFEPGLMNGLVGICFFFSEYDRFFQTDRFKSLLYDVTEIIIDKSQYLTTNFSLCTGLSGVLFGLKHLMDNHHLDQVEFDEEEYAKYILDCLTFYHSNENDDFLHGADGIWYYLLSTDQSKNATEKHLKYLRAKSFKTSNGHITWKYRTLINNSLQECFNLGLSHGVTNRLILLVLSYDKDRQFFADTEFYIKNGVDFLFTCQNPDGSSSSLYPNYKLKESMEEFTESRLGWCYGDLGIAIAYYRIGKILQDKRLVDHSCQIMLNSSIRLELIPNKVFDAGFCHGTSGIAYIFNWFYQETNIEKFKNTAQYWYEQTLKMSQQNSEGRYMAFRSGEYIYDIGLIEGVSGIGLSLISGLDCQKPSWDKFFLL